MARVKTNRRRKTKYTEVEKVAYYMGQVKLGLKNPDSRITASYNAGSEIKTKKPRKTLF